MQDNIYVNYFGKLVLTMEICNVEKMAIYSMCVLLGLSFSLCLCLSLSLCLSVSFSFSLSLSPSLSLCVSLSV